MKRVLVIIPAHNEAARLPAVLKALRVLSLPADLLVIDDASTDGTAELARRGGARVLRLRANLGYGAALQTGYLWAQGRGYAAVAQLDGDGQHLPSELPRILGPLLRGEADMVIGSRWLGVGDYRATAARRAGQLFFAALASLLSGQRLSDPTSGFKAVGPGLARLFASRAFPSDYPDANLLVHLKRHGYRLREAGVRMKGAEKKESMHAGLRPLYYVPVVLLSLFLNLLRPLETGRKD